MSKEIGLTVKKQDDISEWYTQVVLKSGLADYAMPKGFMILRPYGYSIWEKIKSYLDEQFKKAGHQNAYFPSIIPEIFLRKESEHFKGFTPEVFWITHIGDSELNERLAVRPTSETTVYASYSKWIQSWRDLPILLNLWNSVLRGEITSTKPFLRSSEFLWQEGHTAHETKDEADKEVKWALKVYKELIEEKLAVPVLTGYKSEREKFVGALYTITLEALMPDGKALQMGTSHNLGQNFSKPFKIKYIGKDEKEHYVWTTSWGVSWRLIGGVIMMHGDDKGLVLPPEIAPIQIVIIPIFYNDSQKLTILKKIEAVIDNLENSGYSVMVDDREQYTPGWKFNEWELKGVPLRIELGPRDMEKGVYTVVRRDTGARIEIGEDDVKDSLAQLLKDIQENLLMKANAFLDEHILKTDSYKEFKVLIKNGGFVKAGWCAKTLCEEEIKQETGATIRLIPFKKEVINDCIYCGEAGNTAIFAKAY